MANIQWYPGHIAKAEKRLKSLVSMVDVVIEVVDARIPFSSKYENIEALIGNKPRLLILNKSDLGDSLCIDKWIDYYKKNLKIPVLTTSSNSNKDISSVASNAVDLGKEKIAKIVAKGMLPRPIRAIVIGMPNVGKSSIINKLIKKAKVKVGPKAGVTRSSQWVRVHPKLELLDTPGIIPMKLNNQNSATKLAMVNSVSENAYDYVEVAEDLLKLVYQLYPQNLATFCKLLDISKEPSLDDLALSRNWVLRGNEPDTKRSAYTLLSDFRHGRIGRLNLDPLPQI